MDRFTLKIMGISSTVFLLATGFFIVMTGKPETSISLGFIFGLFSIMHPIAMKGDTHD